MKSWFTKLSELIFNIKRVTKLAYEIDGKLLVYYYSSAAIGAVLPIIAALVFKIVLDRFANQDSIADFNSVIVIALFGYFALHTLEIIIYWGLNVGYFDYLLRNKFQTGLNYKFAEKLSGMDISQLEDSDIQNLITKVEHTFTWQIPDFVRIWNYIFKNLVGIIAASIALATFSVWMPLLILIASIPRVYLKVKHGNFVWSMYGGSAPQAKKLWYVADILTDQPSIIESRIFQSRPALLQKFHDLQTYLYDLNKKPLDNYRWVLIFAPILEAVVAFAIIISFLPNVTSGAVTVGTLVFIISSLEQLRNNTAWGAAHLGELYTQNLFVNPFFDLMNLPKVIQDPVNPTPLIVHGPPRIEFCNVGFQYPKGRQVLKNVSFTVEPGERVALVGVNGAGKTTIIKLLCRFYDVDSGEILINGINIKELRLTDWYKFLGTLFQDFVKYNFTVKENILLGNPELFDEVRMHEAAKKSGADGFIENLPLKYEQMLGRRFEKGEELSGGQWQKLAIARAFYEEAPILIMDEPTSAIDAEAEFEIFQNLDKSYQGKTLILVSHRFSTVRNAHKIIVIEQGEIIEMGTHQELLAQNGKYATMFTTQARGYK